MASLTVCAQPYAQAAFEYAKAHRAVTEWEGALAALAKIVTAPQVKQVLSLPAVASAQLADLLVSLLGKQAKPAVKNFIRLLAEYEKLTLLPVIAELFVAIKREAEQRLLAKVVSAKPLDKTQQQKVLDKLQQRFKQKIELQLEVDAALIGGAKVYIGDEVIDGSLQGQLARLASELRV